MDKKIYVAWFTVVIWMVLIFLLSHQPANESSELSQGFTDVVMSIIETVVSPLQIDMDFLHFFIRKSAHFFAYFVLGILVFHALRLSNVYGIRAVLITLGICIIYAISDEVHQLFIPGRSGEVTDVIIDSTGAMVGIFVYIFMLRFLKK